MTTPCSEDPLSRKSEESAESFERHPELTKTKALSLDSGTSGENQHSVNAAVSSSNALESTDALLYGLESGVDTALKYASDWLDYTKILIEYIEKRCSLESEFAKSAAKLATSTYNTISSNVYMTSQSICMDALRTEVGSCESAQRVYELMISSKVLQPMIYRRQEHRKLYKKWKDNWIKSQRDMNSAIHDLNKAKNSYSQKQTDYDKISESLQKASSGDSFTQSFADFVLPKSADGRAEKKTRQKNEAKLRVIEAEMTYKSQLSNVERSQVEFEKAEKEILTSLRHVITDSDLVLKTVLAEYFSMLNNVVTPLPVHFQFMQDGCSALIPGSRYVEFVNKLKLPKKKEKKKYIFEPARPLGSWDLGIASIVMPNRTTTVTDHMSRSENISMSSHSVTPRNTLLSRSVDSSPCRSQPIGNKKLTRSADDIDVDSGKKGRMIRQSNVFSPPTSPSDSQSSKAVYRSHRFRKVRMPSKCKKCEGMAYIHNMECIQCGISVHQKCLKGLKWECGKRSGGGGTLGASRLEDWVTPKRPYFGSALPDQPRIPLLVRMCVREIDRRALDLKGIYRMSGTKSRQKYLCDKFEEQESELSLEDESPNDVTGLLRYYLRELREPLLTYDRFHKLVELARINRLYPQDDIMSPLKSIVDSLPTSHHETTAYLMHHLKRVVKMSHENMMTAMNIGVIFGPTLLRAKDELSTEYVMDQCRIVQIMVEHVEELFGPDTEALSADEILPSEELEEDEITVTDAMTAESLLSSAEKLRSGSLSAIEVDDSFAFFSDEGSLPSLPLGHHPALSLDGASSLPRVKLSQQTSMSMGEFLSLPDASSSPDLTDSRVHEVARGDEVFEDQTIPDPLSPLSPLTPDDVAKIKRFTPARLRAFSPQTHRRFNRDLLRPAARDEDLETESGIVRGHVKRLSADFSNRQRYLLNDDAPSPQGVYRKLPESDVMLKRTSGGKEEKVFDNGKLEISKTMSLGVEGKDENRSGIENRISKDVGNTKRSSSVTDEIDFGVYISDSVPDSGTQVAHDSVTSSTGAVTDINITSRSESEASGGGFADGNANTEAVLSERNIEMGAESLEENPSLRSNVDLVSNTSEYKSD